MCVLTAISRCFLPRVSHYKCHSIPPPLLYHIMLLLLLRFPFRLAASRAHWRELPLRSYLCKNTLTLVHMYVGTTHCVVLAVAAAADDDSSAVYMKNNKVFLFCMYIHYVSYRIMKQQQHWFSLSLFFTLLSADDPTIFHCFVVCSLWRVSKFNSCLVCSSVFSDSANDHVGAYVYSAA